MSIQLRTHYAGMALVAIAVGLICGGTLEAQASPAAAALYNEGNVLYKDGRYQDAIGQYEKALETGLRNGYIYYNLANAYFKDNQIGKAILFYERALKLLPRDKEVRTNLRFANLLKADKDPASNENPILRLVRSAHHAVNPDEQAILCSVLFFLIAATATALIFADVRWRSSLTTAILVLAVILVLSGLSLSAKIHAREFVKTAIVVVDRVDAMSGPGGEYVKHFTLHEGTKATIERQSGDWVLVRLPNGLGGWLKADGIESI